MRERDIKHLNRLKAALLAVKESEKNANTISTQNKTILPEA